MLKIFGLLVYFTGYLSLEGAAILRDVFQKTLPHGIFPTEEIARYVTGKRGNVKRLITLREQTQQGNFDPSNTLQRDLEFMRFLELAPQRNASEEDLYEQFKKVKMYNADEEPARLTAQEATHAEAASREIAQLYWMIDDFVQRGQRVAVIGNARNGARFGTDILRFDLEKLGATVSEYYVRTAAKPSQVEQELKPLSTFLAKQQPEVVVIVDGTSNAQHGEMPRLPSALRHYEQWFSQFADYKTAYWTPNPKDEVYVGSEKKQYVPPVPGEKQVVYAGLKCDFDDPDFIADQESSQPIIVFTNFGLQRIYSGRTEEQIIRGVQEHMTYTLPRTLEETNPYKA